MATMTKRGSRMALAVALAYGLTWTGGGRIVAAQEPQAGRAAAFDQLLDLYVRDGMVYYRALKAERAKLDGYVASLGPVQIDRLSRDEQLAFWLNAYDAVVLETVIDHYPIQRRTNDYPPHSIRQIPGAFERITHRLAGKTLTLDQIEQTILPAFHDPRVYLAVGRGSTGGGRLRSEAFSGARIGSQLADVAKECISRPQCVQIDREQNRVSVSAIFSWREKDFVAAYASAAPAQSADRSPIERAVLAFVDERLLTTERDFLARDQFQVAYRPYDWTLNDLTGRGGR